LKIINKHAGEDFGMVVANFEVEAHGLGICEGLYTVVCVDALALALHESSTICHVPPSVNSVELSEECFGVFSGMSTSLRTISNLTTFSTSLYLSTLTDKTRS
jgi:hypothetical protein